MLLLFGALLYRNGFSLLAIGIISALTSAFFFMNFLSRKALWYGLMIGGVLFAGAAYVSFRTENVSQSFFNRETLSGTVQSVDRELNKTVLVVRDMQYKKLLQIAVRSNTDVLPGDTVSVHGVLEKPEDFLTDTGRLFPYKNYLQSKGIVALVNNASLQRVAKGGFSLNRTGTILRFAIADTFSTYISFPVDGITAGVTSGYQGGIPDYISDLFRTTGVLHVLVLSGENITLLAMFLAIVLRSVPFKLRIALTAAAIVLVVVISGTGVSAVRAGIMGCIALSAGLLRRSYVPLRALTVSVVFFFCYSPSTIFVDPGFHLSVLATIFMIVILPKAKKLFYFLPEKYSIREVAILALCVPLFMLPYTMYFSGLVPLASPAANVLMVIMTPSIMLLGAGLLAVSWLGPIVTLFGLLISWWGTLMLHMLQMLNRLPHVNAPPLAWWGVLLCYAIFFTIVFRKDVLQVWCSFTEPVRSSVLPHPSSSEPGSP